MIKIQFEDLDFQNEAIDSIVDIFKGQSISKSNFTIENLAKQTHFYELEQGISNRIEISIDDILKNVQEIQLKNGLEQTKKLSKDDLNFTIEMETGTGKTYVYLRTIMELNRKYGFTKFIIVVPSIAIKEGVYNSLQITEEDFKKKYENTIYEYFYYDSAKLEEVRNFAVSDNIQIMVINIAAFNKSFTNIDNWDTKANIIHRPNDKLNGNKPIELIQETNPIVIIDEPQSVDTTNKSKEAIASLNPLCTLRYSATHREKHNLMYKLDAIDAFERQLVKQIEVAGVVTEDHHNMAYIKLLSVDNKKTPITAKVEIDVFDKGKIKRKPVTVRKGDDLFDKSKGRDLYSGYIINEIYCEKGYEYIDFTSREEVINLGHSIGDVNDDEIKKIQIRKTIEEHLNKEYRLREKGIKVLSLFFIDKVANYRHYDKDGNSVKGKYALWFEEEYKKLINKPKYRNLISGVDIDSYVEEVHNGYFAADKKGKFKDSSTGTSTDDEDAYSLIMKDKEKLLSFDSKLKFIFSHSALKEGWDNPNVFQICTLNETKSIIKKRQEIGRGLRLAVNQEGRRVYGFDVNTLTVMANESYEDFAKNLQREFEEEAGIKFGVIEKHSFSNITYEEFEERRYLGEEKSETLYNHLKEENYIDKYGKVTDELRRDLRDGLIKIPNEFNFVEDKVVHILRKVAGSLNIKNADNKQYLKLNKEVYLSPEFKELWDKIKFKTRYSVEFDTEKLINQCSDEILRTLKVSKGKYLYTKGNIQIDVGGIQEEERERVADIIDERHIILPDLITLLQNETNLTRKTLVRILIKSGRLGDFKNNPQKYMEEVAGIIKRNMRTMLVDGIKYTKIGDDEFYAQELFEDIELSGYLNRNLIESKKSIHDYIIYDSDNEESFARKFEANNSVKLYAKLPNWFKIDTPLGSYNPDWAVMIDKDGEEKLYFVIETKGSTLAEDLRLKEAKKIDCAKEHFKAIDTDVSFKATDSFEKFMGEI